MNLGTDCTYPEECKMVTMERIFNLFFRRREVAERQKGASMGAASPPEGEAGDKEKSWTRISRA